MPTTMQSDATVFVTRPVKLFHRQHQHLLNKTPKECGIFIRRHYSKEDDSSRHSGYQKFSDDDSISGNYFR